MRSIPVIAVLAVGVSLHAAEPERGPVGVGPASPAVAAQDTAVDVTVPHSVYFARAAYGSGGMGWGRRRAWGTDYPEAERHFTVVLERLTNADVYRWEHALRLDDPRLRRFPFLYAVEVGYMDLSEAEAAGLRGYLLAGGFLVVDDFWGTQEWASFEHNIRKVFPDRPIREVPPDHPVFHTYYSIDEIVQVPSINNVLRRGRTWERDGYTPHVRGIFADDGRLMVAINWNTDLGDAWEWADVPEYPLEYSTFAFEMGVNYIVYALSH